jgi:hypothetical protein
VMVFWFSRFFFFLRSGDHGEHMSDTKRICDDIDCGQEKKQSWSQQVLF